MMCSTRELELGDEHDGIIELPADAPVGTAFADYARLEIRCSTSRSRPTGQDCMGVHGIARDLAAAGLGTLKPLDVSTQSRGSFAVPGRRSAPTIPKAARLSTAGRCRGVTQRRRRPTGCSSA